MSGLPEGFRDGALRVLNRLGENRYAGWLMWLFPYRNLHISRDKWENQYCRGQWTYLNDIKELSRYSIISGYCNHIHPVGRILDVGCGEGILLEHLCSERAEHYTGIDISTEAIRAARERQSGKARFIVADTMKFELEENFDIIVFNECLYYYEDPRKVLNKYAGMLGPGGIIVVSLYTSPRTRRIWKMLKSDFIAEDETRIANNSGNAWTIKVFLA
jgi:2-polyprenyl-6-hydroxyphenyl methylase/3-demethylubiquinone-9 3-methyltransferase